MLSNMSLVILYLSQLYSCLPRVVYFYYLVNKLNMHSYQVRLMSDAELISKAESIYGAESLLSKKYTLDSSRFGATMANPICQICHQNSSACIGHFSVVRLPFPIPKVVCLKDFKLIIPLLCPICSHFIIDNVKQALDLLPSSRLSWIRKETIKYTAKGTKMVICNTCHNRIKTISLAHVEPSFRFEIQTPGQESGTQISPIQVCNVLQNFSELSEGGFNPNYHPANFMTYFLPIVPNKLRPKTLMSEPTESSLTAQYKQIISNICVELDRIKRQLNLNSNVTITKGQLQTDFNKYYDKLYSHYLLITAVGTQSAREEEMTIIDKRDRRHAEQSVGMLTRLKSKHKKSLWQEGVIGSRHDVSMRTVLGGAMAGNTYNLQIPEHAATKLSMMYPVYAQNLEGMKQIVAKMADPKVQADYKIPKALGVYNSNYGYFNTINQKNAMSKATLLQPGDLVSVSLINGDWVMECRFPLLCEEGFGSYKVLRYDGTTLKVPFSCLKKQNGDLDGDEVQAYAFRDHTTDAESILLHSPWAQMIGYKTGTMLIWWGEASKDGVSQIKAGKTISVYNNHRIKETPVEEIIEKLLPKGITYEDKKTCIINGKFQNGKVNVNNHELFKYIYYTYGPLIAEELLSRLVDFGYDINRDNGNTLGFEITFSNKAIHEQCMAIRNEAYQKVCEIEKSSDSDQLKLINQFHAMADAKIKVQQLIIEDNKGNSLDKLGFISSRLEEFSHMIYQMDYTIIEGSRISNTLAEGSRVSCSFPRFSIDPMAYGYHPYSYTEGISAYEQLLDSKQSRETFYIKGQGVATQGYFSKRISTACGNNFCNWNRQVEDGFKIVSPQYGSLGQDPRSDVILDLEDLDVADKEFDEKYKQDKRLCELHRKIKEIQNRYRRVSNFTQRSNITNKFSTVYHFNQIFKHAQK